MDRDDIIRMAREAGFKVDWQHADVAEIKAKRYEYFAALVTATERNKLAAWMIERGYATGHGDTIEDLLQELDWQIAENWTRGMVNGVHAEREACAKVVEILIPEQTEDGLIGHTIAKAIRERGEQ